jgi:putative ABC transport system permease protein
VLAAEPFRAVRVRLTSGHRSRTTSITGLVPDPTLSRVVDRTGRVAPIPPDGLLLSAKLAEILDVRPGQPVTVRVREGRRPVLRVPVAAVVDDLVGTNAYMSLPALHRRLQEGAVLSGAYLAVDPSRLEALYRTVKRLPRIAGVALRAAAIESFRKTLLESFVIMRDVTILFAVIIAAGVVYNTARVSLSERQRELATLRVLGLTRGEISYVLLGELAILTLAAVPLGLGLGWLMAAGMVRIYDTEVFRMPLVVARITLVRSAVTVLVASALSSLAVRRRLDRLDLIAVLKARE